MKRNLIFVFLLLVTLSVANAFPLMKRDVTTFSQCPSDPKNPDAPPLDTFNVTMVPDPPVSGAPFNLTIVAQEGQITKDLPDGSLVAVIFYDLATMQLIGEPIGGLLCNAPGTCPIAAGTPFTSTVSGTAPTLPDRYLVAAAIADPNQVPVACSFAIVPDNTVPDGTTPAPPADGGDGTTPPPDGGAPAPDGGAPPPDGSAPAPDGSAPAPDGGDGTTPPATGTSFLGALFG